MPERREKRGGRGVREGGGGKRRGEEGRGRERGGGEKGGGRKPEVKLFEKLDRGKEVGGRG